MVKLLPQIQSFIGLFNELKQKNKLTDEVNHEHQVADSYIFCTVVPEFSSFMGNPVQKNCVDNE